jgi:serine/threonine-protein kinase
MATAADELIGQELNGYKVLDKVKDGSVGSIYMAGKDSKLFALKMLFDKHMPNPEKRSRFKREAKVASSLDHKNVIKTYEYYDGPPRPFFVMEFFPSENLKFIEAHQPQRLEKTRYGILRRIGEGLQYCHSQGIVHRDIKPENVLIGENFEVKLIDFSIATTKMDRLLSFLTQKAAGSPSYMAPEQILNKKTDQRADIYAFGILAYELLSGQLPFNGKSMQEVFEKHCKATARPIRELNPQVPPEVAELLPSLMEKDPEKRPGDLRQAIYIIGKREATVTKRLAT